MRGFPSACYTHAPALHLFQELVRPNHIRAPGFPCLYIYSTLMHCIYIIMRQPVFISKKIYRASEYSRHITRLHLSDSASTAPARIRIYLTNPACENYTYKASIPTTHHTPIWGADMSFNPVFLVKAGSDPCVASSRTEQLVLLIEMLYIYMYCIYNSMCIKKGSCPKGI